MRSLWCRLFHRKHWRPARFFVIGDLDLPEFCARCHRVHYTPSEG